MSVLLRMHLHRTEGALLRCLGVIERRGFVLQSMHCIPAAHNTAVWELTVELTGERSVETLCHQLNKLWDVDQTLVLNKSTV
jgi:acetolactate synthase regulatory subunit